MCNNLLFDFDVSLSSMPIDWDGLVWADEQKDKLLHILEKFDLNTCRNCHKLLSHKDCYPLDSATFEGTEMTFLLIECYTCGLKFFEGHTWSAFIQEEKDIDLFLDELEEALEDEFGEEL